MPSFPRNVEVVFGHYDEFAPLMWGVAKGADVGRSPKLEGLFGSPAPVIPGRIYGSIAAGTGRLLVIPPHHPPARAFFRRRNRRRHRLVPAHPSRRGIAPAPG
jgi:hypothetical protein